MASFLSQVPQYDPTDPYQSHADMIVIINQMSWADQNNVSVYEYEAFPLHMTSAMVSRLISGLL